MTITMQWYGTRSKTEDNIVRMTTSLCEGWANLPLYLDEVNHASELNWGYWGSGPAQLAYAILRTYYEIALGVLPETAAAYAQKYHNGFMKEVVSRCGDTWSLTDFDVTVWLTQKLYHIFLGNTITSGCPISKN